MSSHRPTLEDVAKRAQVSSATVSRVINEPKKVSAQTVERVRAAIQETGYVPNLLAGGLASNRSRFVAALVPSIGMSILNDTMEAMTHALADSGYLGMLALLDDGPSHAATLDAIIGRRPEAIILTSIEEDKSTRDKLRNSNASIIETWALPSEPIDLAVGFSHQIVGRKLAEHLASLGYERPAMLYAGLRRSRERMLAFADRWKELKGKAPAGMLVDSPDRYGPARKAIKTYFKKDKHADIVVCSSDWLADATAIELAALGISIPNEVAVFGFGDTHASSEGAISLSTVKIDGAAIGQTAAKMLLDRAEGRTIKESVVDIGFEFLDRDSA